MRKDAERVLTNRSKKPKKNRKDIEKGTCMRGKDGKLGFSKKDRKRICINHLEEIMNEKNDWDHMTEANVVEKPIEKITPAKKQ